MAFPHKYSYSHSELDFILILSVLICISNKIFGLSRVLLLYLQTPRSLLVHILSCSIPYCCCGERKMKMHSLSKLEHESFVKVTSTTSLVNNVHFRMKLLKIDNCTKVKFMTSLFELYCSFKSDTHAAKKGNLSYQNVTRKM